MGLSIAVEDVDDLLFQWTDGILEGVGVCFRKIGKFLIVSGSDRFVGNQVIEILFDLVKIAIQGKINVVQLVLDAPGVSSKTAPFSALLKRSCQLTAKSEGQQPHKSAIFYT